MPEIPFVGRLILAVVVVMILAQVAPEPVNVVLVLILVGLLLSKSVAFSELFRTISKSGRKV